MRIFVGVTDFDWFKFLSTASDIDEVNFWQPSGTNVFRALGTGEPFLFKLHSPRDYIVGGGFFAHSTILPTSLAWNAFREKNGASSIEEMRSRIEKYRRTTQSSEDYQVGCILLEQPFFFNREDWISVPSDWSPNIVRGKGYETGQEEGKKLWEQVQFRLQARGDLLVEVPLVADETTRYGEPVLVAPRLGQGSFRIVVTDAYDRRCAVTQERVLPALEASHIKPFGESGPHRIENGILLRSDIHRLFDTGYVTVSLKYRFEVSRRIKDDFDNGKNYYALHGSPLHLPRECKLRPAAEFISWHNSKKFLG